MMEAFMSGQQTESKVRADATDGLAGSKCTCSKRFEGSIGELEVQIAAI